MYHPLTLLYTVLPFPAAFGFGLLLPYPAAALGTYLFLRGWQLPREAALFGGLVFAYGSYHLYHFVHANAVMTSMHLPWALACLDVFCRGQRVRWAGAWTGLVLITASEILSGHFQSVLIITQAELLYLIVLGKLRLSVFGAWLSATAIGAACGAVQLLPTWQMIALSERSDVSLEFKYGGSLHPLNLIQLISPRFFSWGYYSSWGVRSGDHSPHEYSISCGSVAAVLSVWGVARRRAVGGKDTPRLVLAALVLFGFGAVLALGRYGFLYRIQARLPVVGKFRVPCRYIVLAQFAMAVLSAVAIADLVRLRGEKRSPVPRAVWGYLLLAVLVGSGCLAIRIVMGPDNPFLIAGKRPILLGISLTSLATVLTVATVRSFPGAFLAMCLLAVIDPLIAPLRFLTDPEPQTMAEIRSHIPVPPGQNGYRIFFYNMNNPKGQTWDDTPLLAGVHLVDRLRRFAAPAFAQLFEGGRACALRGPDGWVFWEERPLFGRRSLILCPTHA